MNSALRPRLMPVFIAGGAGLLILKVVGLATQGGYMFTPDAPRHTQSLRSVADRLANDEFTGAAPAASPPKPAAEKKPEPAPQPLPPPAVTAAEREVLEQLASRRKQLDERARELDLREGLLKSAEKMAQDRLEELRKSEQKSDATEQRPNTDLKSLVTIYETMKPREAARVFDRMDPQRLAPLARQMQPKKLAEIVSAMMPETAEKLTFMLMPVAQPAPRAAEAKPEELQRLPRNPGVQ